MGKMIGVLFGGPLPGPAGPGQGGFLGLEGFHPRLHQHVPGGADLEADVEEFPLLVRLDSVLDFTKVKAGGADIRFADPDGTLLPHEIELFDAAAKTCLAWVRVPRVDASSLTDHIVLYWNNPAAAAIKAAVFDTALGYVAVYHLGEERLGIGDRGRVPGRHRQRQPRG